jgi:hypothetical protein
MTRRGSTRSAQLIDLMALVGMYAGTAALLTVFDMQLDPGETHLLPSLQ